ncbi:FAST kinase domain-containing protein 4 isoform X1 [Arctopsyche grandis]|uniref:FAST kinase domain-containing protein 4 isoform X1 n=1 Tax=Arctopsyche grandis TaxID=121162 RepID=UPI00406D9528
MLKLAIRRQIWWWAHDPRPLYIINRAAQTSVPLPDPTIQDSRDSKTENSSTGLVASVFETLNTESNTSNSKLSMNQFLELRTIIKNEIEGASDVATLLAISERKVTRQESLKIITTLANWATTQKVKLADFDTDPRFLQMCKMLGKSKHNITTKSKSEDLDTVLEIKGDDEAARLISNLNIPQMIKVMSALSQKKRRSTPLLRTLSFNISRHADIIDIKKCADLLFSMASLSFPDPVLMDRICNDIQENIPLLQADRSSVIGSIVTSFGILKYKNEKLMDNLISWVLPNIETVRSQDIFSIVLTMATLNYNPSNIDIQKLVKLTKMDLVKPSNWLDYVWSLLVLEHINEEHVTSILNIEFVESLKVDGEIPFPCQKKLSNINGYASVMNNYKGPMLPKDLLKQFKFSYSKEKQEFVALLHGTLKSLLSSETNIKKNCNSEMGFLFDAMCILDPKCNPHPVNSDISQKKNLTRVAMLALDYHDLCKNTMDPLGQVVLYKRLLEAQKFKVLLILYTDFNPRDKLVNRVQYIENKLKEIVKENSSSLKK